MLQLLVAASGGLPAGCTVCCEITCTYVQLLPWLTVAPFVARAARIAQEEEATAARRAREQGDKRAAEEEALAAAQKIREAAEADARRVREAAEAAAAEASAKLRATVDEAARTREADASSAARKAASTAAAVEAEAALADHLAQPANTISKENEPGSGSGGSSPTVAAEEGEEGGAEDAAEVESLTHCARAGWSNRLQSHRFDPPGCRAGRGDAGQVRRDRHGRQVRPPGTPNQHISRGILYELVC